MSGRGEREGWEVRDREREAEGGRVGGRGDRMTMTMNRERAQEIMNRDK